MNYGADCCLNQCFVILENPEKDSAPMGGGMPGGMSGMMYYASHFGY